MTLATLVLLLHGDDSRIDLLYFWAAVLLALTPLLVLGTIGVLVVREILHRHRAGAEGGTPDDATTGDTLGPP